MIEAAQAFALALAGLGPQAVAVLGALMDDGAEPGHRLRAASIMLDAVARAGDADIRARLAAVERTLGVAP